MTNPNRARRRFTLQQKEEAVALCLAEGLTCTAVAQRLGIPVSSLAKWVRQARIDRGELSGSGQGPLTSEERNQWLPRYLSIYNRLRKHAGLGDRSPQQRLNELLR